MPIQGMGHFIQLYPVPTNLYLIVDAAMEGNLTVREPSPQVASPVKRGPRDCAERMFDKALGGQCGII